MVSELESYSHEFHRFTAGLYEHRDLHSFTQYLLSDLRRFIPADSASWKAISSNAPHVTAVFVPDIPAATALLPLYEQHVREHPVYQYWRQSGQHDIAVRWSDVKQSPPIMDLPLYKNFYRPLGIHHQLMLCLHSTPSDLAYVALNRTHRPFTDQERAMLTALYLHASQALRQVNAHHQLQSTLTTLSTFVDTMTQGVLCLSPDFQLNWANKQARTLLSTHFRWVSTTRHLPEALQQWVIQSQHHPGVVPRAFSTQSRAGCLRVRVLRDRKELYLILEESKSRNRLDRLKSFRLTNRQLDVLTLLSQGMSNELIALRLGIGSPTVKKHLEHIYRALGVENRVEATLKAHNLFDQTDVR